MFIHRFSLYSMTVLLWLFIVGCQEQPVIEEYNENNQLIASYEINADSLRHGKYQRFYENGHLYEEAYYNNDDITGTRKLYFPTGDLQIEENYKDGKFEGGYKEYFQNGQIQSHGQYVNNEMSGEWKVYYPDGTLHKVITFAHNEENGPFKTYWPNGQLQDEGHYIGGDNIDGEFRIYDKRGHHVRTMDYDRGRGKVTWTKPGVVFEDDTIRYVD